MISVSASNHSLSVPGDTPSHSLTQSRWWQKIAKISLKIFPKNHSCPRFKTDPSTLTHPNQAGGKKEKTKSTIPLFSQSLNHSDEKSHKILSQGFGIFNIQNSLYPRKRIIQKNQSCGHTCGHLPQSFCQEKWLGKTMTNHHERHLYRSSFTK